MNIEKLIKGTNHLLIKQNIIICTNCTIFCSKNYQKYTEKTWCYMNKNMITTY